MPCRSDSNLPHCLRCVLQVQRALPSALSISLIFICAMLLTVGCETTGSTAGSGSTYISTTPTTVTGAHDAYRRGNFAAAYTAAKPIADRGGSDASEAAYITGISAYYLRRGSEAQRYLTTASASHNVGLAGDAYASLGRIYAEQGNHTRAAQMYVAAGTRLLGEERATAYYFAAQNQQKVGQWTGARQNLISAKNASGNRNLRSRIDQQLQVRGWTLQFGAYSNSTNAKKAAQSLASKNNTSHLGSPRLVPAINSKGQRLTLVQIGQFSSQFAASSASRFIPDKAVIVPLATQ
jgi:tetratricopeptide (TPR) repeat protein